jgi:hypothetical protein
VISLGTISTAGLLRLRLSVTHRPEPDSLQVDLTDGGTEWIRGWTAPLATLGLASADRTAERLAAAPGTSGAERDPAREAALGEPLSALFAGLRGRISGRDALWLELARPKGILPCLPWERWLAPLVGVPVLRLPRHFFKPVRSRGPMHVAWCAGPSPEPAASRIDRLRAGLEGLVGAGARPELHVFADPALRGDLERAFGAGRTAAVRLYSLEGRSYSGTGDGGGPVADPWLRWMSQDLPQGVDLVCFDTPGSLARGRGGLLFDRTPLAGTSRGLRVEGTELTSFLDAVGASGLALSSPPGNPNVSGLLALAEEIVDGRPGPVFFHDAAGDPAGQELGAGLAFLYGDAGPPRASPFLAVYCHPDRLGGEPKVTIEFTREEPARPSLFRGAKVPGVTRPSLRLVLDDFTPASQIRPSAPASAPAAAPPTARPRLGMAALPGDDRLRSGMEPESYGAEIGPAPAAAAQESPAAENPGAVDIQLPRWLEASQRVLERHVSWSAEVAESPSAAGKAAQEGAEEALRFVKELLARKTGEPAS